MATKRKSWLRTGALAILGLGIVYGSQSFTDKGEAKPAKKLVNQTWYFTGDASDNPELAGNYSSSPSGLPNCGSIKEVICQISAPDDGTGKPKMNEPVDGTTVQQQIHEAQESLQNGTPTENTTVTGFRPE